MDVPEIKPKGFGSDTYGESRTILGLTPEEDAFSAAVVLIIIGIVAIGFCVYMAVRKPEPCQSPNSFACIDQRIQECMASERYTKEQCVILIGGNK